MPLAARRLSPAGVRSSTGCERVAPVCETGGAETCAGMAAPRSPDDRRRRRHLVRPGVVLMPGRDPAHLPHPVVHGSRTHASQRRESPSHAGLFSSCSTARRIHAETDRSSASARRLTSARSSGGNRTGMGAVRRLVRRRGPPCGSWLAGSA